MFEAARKFIKSIFPIRIVSERERINNFFDKEAPALVKKAARDIVHKHLKEIAKPQTAEEIRAANPLRKQPKPAARSESAMKDDDFFPIPVERSRAKRLEENLDFAMEGFRKMRALATGSVGMIVRSWPEKDVLEEFAYRPLRDELLYHHYIVPRNDATPRIKEEGMLIAAARYLCLGNPSQDQRVQDTLQVLDDMYRESRVKLNYPRMVIDRRAKLPTRKRKYVKSRDCCCCAQQGRHPPSPR